MGVDTGIDSGGQLLATQPVMGSNDPVKDMLSHNSLGDSRILSVSYWSGRRRGALTAMLIRDTGQVLADTVTSLTEYVFTGHGSP